MVQLVLHIEFHSNYVNDLNDKRAISTIQAISPVIKRSFVSGRNIMVFTTLSKCIPVF